MARSPLREMQNEVDHLIVRDVRAALNLNEGKRALVAPDIADEGFPRSNAIERAEQFNGGAAAQRLERQAFAGDDRQRLGAAARRIDRQTYDVKLPSVVHEQHGGGRRCQAIGVSPGCMEFTEQEVALTERRDLLRGYEANCGA
jgi:hypothetical protein